MLCGAQTARELEGPCGGVECNWARPRALEADETSSLRLLLRQPGQGRAQRKAVGRRRIQVRACDFGSIIALRWDSYEEATQIGKLASLSAVTVTPRKDTNTRLPVGGPFFFVFLGGLSRSSWFFLSSIEAVISQRTCAQGLYYLIISYL